MKLSPIHCRILIFSLCFGMGFTAIAQQNKKEGTIQNEDIVIDKERKIEIQPQVSRTFESLVEQENVNKGRKMKYEFIERKWEGGNLVPLQITTLAPREGDEERSAYGQKFKNILKLGAGNYGHTYFNGHLGFQPNENQFRGIYINHDYNRKGPDNSTYSGRGENEVKLYSKTFTDKYLLNGHINYRNQVANFYGQEIPKLLNKDLINISYDQFTYFGSISNAKLDSKFDYKASSGLNFISSSKLDKEWVWDSKIQTIMKLNDNISAQFNGDMIISEYTSDINNRRQLYRVRPSFMYQDEKVMVQAGLNVVNEKDQEKGLNSTYWLPIVKLDYKIVPALHWFAGLGGDTYFYSYQQNVQNIAWLDRRINLLNTQETTNLYTGFKGSNEKSIDYEFKFAYSEFGNLGFYVANNPADVSKYSISYEGSNGNKKVQVFQLSGQFNFQTSDRLLSVFKFDYNQYQSLTSLPRPFHRPALNMSFTNSITFKDRIIISPDIYYVNGLYGWNPVSRSEVKMDPILDLNLKVNYLITKKFNAIVSINNILDKKYQRFLNYQVMGLNYTVAIAYSF